LLPYLDLVIGREETPKPKPEKEALEHTAKLLQLNPNELVFVGDHPIDSTCAENAQVRFIGVLTGAAKPETWREAGCSEVLQGIWELPEYLEKTEK
ncbi:MAG: HAD family hydrolase, partial [Candidatus Bathyarchaeia archaeon]